MCFPLDIVEPNVPFQAIFAVEPLREMHEAPGMLGDLIIKLLFVPSENEADKASYLSSGAMDELIIQCETKHVNIGAQYILQEAGELVIK